MTQNDDQQADCQRLADAMAQVIGTRDTSGLEAIYTDNLTVWHNDDRKTQSREENIAHLASIFSMFSSLRYGDVKITCTTDGFVQQHVLNGILNDGRSVEIPACLVFTVTGGKIEHIDEYLDPSPFLALMTQGA
jgi:ketosteroid isomerase-like protein